MSGDRAPLVASMRRSAYPARMTNDPALRAAAKTLVEALHLALPPIAVCFSNERPEGMATFEGSVPAGCAFWERAAQGPIVTATRDHELCSIGVHTHNLASPSPSVAKELAKTLEVMQELRYVRDEDVAALPVVRASHPYVTYAPLADAPLAPAVVLLFADAAQSLVVSEAVSLVDAGAPPAMGRPACAVIPAVMNGDRAALSLGCCGARAYLDVLSAPIALWALPGAKVGRYAEHIAQFAAANHTLTQFHAARRTDVESGERPTISESLSRM
jgi:uncharacterized protein (DUF169 family)